MQGGPAPIQLYTPCRWCRHFDGLTAGGTVAQCSCTSCSRICGSPESGCSCWERLPGIDDDADADLVPYGQALALPTFG
jgi:hypothetical protein